jgi:hypothetical protein
MPQLKGIWKEYEGDERFWIRPLEKRAVPGSAARSVPA